MTSSAPTRPTIATEFRARRAVETWDALFRWRSAGLLRDVTVDDTWARVADALSEDPAHAAAYRDAFARFRMLPDARLLRFGGTDTAVVLADRIHVVVNVAAFVSRRAFNRDAFARTAELARLLVGDAVRYCPREPGGPRRAIGLIGFADARAALGLPACSDVSRQFAQGVAMLLAAHAGRENTALTLQPNLARLANDVADGFDGEDQEALLEIVQPWLPELA